MLLAIAVWQVVMLWAVGNTHAPEPERLSVALAHVGLLVLALLARRAVCPPWLVVLLIYPTVLWDWHVAQSVDEVLAFAACWLSHLTAASLAVTVRGRAGVVLAVVAAAGMPVAIHVINPHWVISMPIAVGVTTLAITVATRLGLLLLSDFARQADAEASAAEAEVRTMATVRAASSEAAEDARILHDTVVNTLGAIANGGAGIADVDAVRSRCARDARVVEDIQAAGSARQLHGTTLSEIFDPIPIAIHRTGVDDAVLAQIDQGLARDVKQVLVRAATEVLNNVVKHARVHDVRVDISIRGDDLVITIEDDGVGFDGHVPPGRGLANSVMARAREVGVNVGLVTEPGGGTSVTLTTRLDEPAKTNADARWASAMENKADDVVASIRVQSGWLWAVGLTLVGLMIEPFNRFGQFTASYLMLLVIAAVTAYAWITRDQAGRLPQRAVVALGVGASAAFVLSAWASDFGRHDVIYWQAIGATGPLVLLVANDVGRAAIRASVALFVATVVTLTAIVWQDSAMAASILPVGAVACLGMMAAWHAFQSAIVTVGAKASEDYLRAVRVRLAVAIRVAADDARRRWRVAGLAESGDLLRKIADGVVDPAAPSTRAACAREEIYLRQLTQLHPDLTLMGEWCARALHEGRRRDARFVVRTGEVDAPDEQTAAKMGQVLLAAVSSTPPGALVSATIFPSPDGLRLTVVSPRSGLEQARHLWRPAPNSTMTYRTVEDQDLLEIVVQAPQRDLAAI